MKNTEKIKDLTLKVLGNRIENFLQNAEHIIDTAIILNETYETMHFKEDKEKFSSLLNVDFLKIMVRLKNEI